MAGAFTVLGITGGADLRVDAWLNALAEPVLEWTASTGAVEYELRILSRDGAAEVCPPLRATAGASSVGYAAGQCALAESVTYRAVVVALDASGCGLAASNAPFFFTVSAGMADWTLSVEANDDDGCWAVHDNPAVSCEGGLGYLGESSMERYWGFFRFRLPQGLPAAVQIDEARLELFGRETWQWNPGDGLAVWFDLSADAPAVAAADGLPGTGPIRLTRASADWPSPGAGLAWRIGDYNPSTNLAAPLQEVIGEHGGLRAGATLQAWVGTQDLELLDREVGFVDYAEDPARAALLVVRASGRTSPGPFRIAGVAGGRDLTRDGRLTDLAAPAVHWTESVGASHYEVSILEADGSTVRCPPVSASWSATSVVLPGCALVEGQGYKATVRAVDSAGAAQSAENDLFAFEVGQALEPAYPASGANWNDYADRREPSTPSYRQAADRPCLTTAPGRCVHGGELKRFATNLPSCSGVAARDLLGAFRWVCEDLSGNAVVYSTGLERQKRLSDLLEADGTGWRQNQLIVEQDGTPVFQSAPAAWWSNAVQPLPDNRLPTDAVVTLAQPGTLYTLTASRASSGYRVRGAGVGLVVYPGAVLSWAGGSPINCRGVDGEASPADERCLVVFDGASHPWVEGRFEGGLEADALLKLALASGGVLRRLELRGGSGTFWSDSLSFNTAGDFRVEQARFVEAGLRLHWGNHRNVFQDLVLDAGRLDAYNATRADATLAGLVASSTALFHEDVANTLTHLTAINGAGVVSRAPAGRLVVAQALILNTNQAFRVEQTGSAGNAFATLAVDHTDQTFYFLDVVAENRVSGPVLLGPDATVCENDGTSTVTGVAAPLCGNGGSNAASYRAVGALAAEIVGPLGTADAANASNAAGAAAHDAIVDWFGFESPYRLWGHDDASWPSQTSRSQCGSGETCRIYDLRLRSGGAVLRNRSGDGLGLNEPFAAGAPCPSAVQGDVTSADFHMPRNVFLINAIEIPGDGQGDDDGLCESFESCVYSPNFGAYQGEGDFWSNGPCQFQDGRGSAPVAGVRMYAYPANGVP